LTWKKHEPFSPPTTVRYRFYSIAVSKRALFEAGGRPVIYLPDYEGNWIPPEEKWRQVRYEHGSVDFTREREWRVPGDLDLTKLNGGIYVIVWSTFEEKDLATFPTPMRQKVLSIISDGASGRDDLTSDPGFIPPTVARTRTPAIC